MNLQLKPMTERLPLKMTNYLISKGHRRIAFIRGHPSHLSVNDRAKGFFDSFKSGQYSLSQ